MERLAARAMPQRLRAADRRPIWDGAGARTRAGATSRLRTSRGLRSRPEPPQSRFETEPAQYPHAFRIFLVPFLVVVLLTKFDFREVLGLAIFWVAAITDFLDGWVARRRREVTRLGTLLDPIADKLLTSAAFISLVDLGVAPAWTVVVIVGREFAVSGLRSIAADRGIMIPASPLGKFKMFTQIAAISLLIVSFRFGRLHTTSQVALYTVVFFAVASAVDYFAKFWKRVLSEEPLT
jgi:CDP-diacylglycerol--glycerol-3-phosphate 3-phosphatidyltransferase